MPKVDQAVTSALYTATALRQLGDRLMDQARIDLHAQKLCLADYYKVSDHYQRLVSEATAISLNASSLVARDAEAGFAKIAELTKGLQESLGKLQRIEHVLVFSLKVLVAAGSIAIAVVNPGVATVAAAVAALVETGQMVDAEIRGEGPSA